MHQVIFRAKVWCPPNHFEPLRPWREKHGPIRTVLTNVKSPRLVTFVWKKKVRYYEQIRLTLSTKEPKLYRNVDSKPNINQKIFNLMKPHLMQIHDHCNVKFRFASRTVFKISTVFFTTFYRHVAAHQQCLIKMLSLHS